ncbi:MAG: NAD+ synthase [Acidimicrobiaceae bacterium]|nr:NAD+ synthase [Acidimicrobiaceae bacterium]
MGILRLAIAQINPVVGDLEGNVELIRDLIDKVEHCDLAVFGEMSLTGYPLEDLLLKPGFIADNKNALNDLASMSGNCALVIGFADSDEENVYNSIAICHKGKIVGSYRKQNLPNVEVFDEVRNFSPGSDSLNLFSIGGVTIGFVICHDLWVPNGPVKTLVDGGAQLIVATNGSPFHRGKQQEREILVNEISQENNVPVAYVNLVGGQDELVFDGGSFITDSAGEVILRSPRFHESVLVADLSVEKNITTENYLPVIEVSSRRDHEGIIETSIAPTLDTFEELYLALMTATRDYVLKSGFQQVCLGLSGGIDSALVAAIASDSLGPNNVTAVMMPSRYSSIHSLTDAEQLIKNLGIASVNFSIKDIHSIFLEQWALNLNEEILGVADENLQSRIRGVLLMAFANANNWLVLTTGNKSEAAVGYSTLYGDTAGAYAVIKDVYKTGVYDLARWRNESAGHEIIPNSIIEKPPSAELRPDQRDDQSLPPYEILDPLLKSYIEGDRTRAELVEDGFDAKIVDEVVQMVDTSEYKRRQNPPGVRVTRKGFGRDRRLPLVNRYKG